MNHRLATIFECDRLTPEDSLAPEHCNSRGLLSRCRESLYYRRPPGGTPDEPTTERLQCLLHGLRRAGETK